jgi:hypothetical protein
MDEVVKILIVDGKPRNLEVARAEFKRVVEHVSDDRFREIAISANGRQTTPPAVLSRKEAEHFRNCPDCIERLGEITRQILQGGNAQ